MAPDEEKPEKATSETRLRVFAAGGTIGPFYTTNYVGVQVNGVVPGFPAELAGIRAGGVNTGINGGPFSHDGGTAADDDGDAPWRKGHRADIAWYR